MIRVTSASTAAVSCAVVWMLSCIRCAMTFRIRERGSVRAGPPGPLVGAASRGAEVRASPRSTAARTSSSVIRPPCPVPRSARGSNPCSRTRRRTSGERRIAAASGRIGEAGVGPERAPGAGRASGAGRSMGSDVIAAGPATAVAAGADAGTSGAPSVSSSRSTAPTATSDSIIATSRVTVPAPGLGTSVSTLSVDTSAIACPSATTSPTATSHATSVPPSTDSPSSGSVTAVVIGRLSPRRRPRRAGRGP